MAKPIVRSLPLLALLLCVPIHLAASTVQKTKQFGQPRSDKALVYAIRERAFVGSAVGMFVFADEQLISFLRNGTYGFAYIDPGQHIIWGDTDATVNIRLMPGETYYITAKVAGPLTVVSESDGKALLDSIGAYIQADDKDLENGAKRVAKRFDKAKKRDARTTKEVEELPAASAAATEGALKLGANTKLSVELMENLTSGLDRAGQTVWLRVAEDVTADGKVVIPHGTPVRATMARAQRSSGHGTPGNFNATLVSIDLDAEHRIPIVGDVSSSGKQRTAGVVSGGLIGMMTRGTEAFQPAGTRYSAWIRDDTSLQPFSATATASHPAATAAPPIELAFGGNSYDQLPSVTISFPCAAEPVSVELVSIGDWPLPERVKALSAARDKENCSAAFEGWSVLRFVHPGTTQQTLHVVGKDSGGEAWYDVPVTLRVD